MSPHPSIPFNVAPLVGCELDYIREALNSRHLQGNGSQTRVCQAWLKQQLGVADALLTQSCTAALELAALLCDLQPGDEVIMPSFTFVSTANAVVLRRAVPVFVDIRDDTFNIDENLVAAAITPRTRAIFAVHYAGVCAEMDALRDIATRYNLTLVEDAAQALGSTYYDRPAGALADMGCFSFHESKNIVSGEGGALTFTHDEFLERAYIVWEKGTNRRQFHLGQVDKYTWVDVGSSFLPSEITAAVLRAQLEATDSIIADRRGAWHNYHEALASLEVCGLLRRPQVPKHCRHNAHIYAVLLSDGATRDGLIAALRAEGITAPFHYVPLHSAPAGQRYGRTAGPLPVTEHTSATLLRLPLWYGIGDRVYQVVEQMSAYLTVDIRPQATVRKQ
jgi:dTDP-4-amino-4,6-dideoxygalactose transaminase